MTSYITITDAETDPSAPITSELAKKWRDNPLAIAEGDSTAPVNQTAWHPYNKVTVNDANTGIIYNFPTDGAVATVTSPDFQDGYEYAFMFADLASSAASATLRIDWYRETSAAYSGVTSVSGATLFSSTTLPLNAFFALPFVRFTRRYHILTGESLTGSTNIFVDANTTSIHSGVASDPVVVEGIRHATPQKILRVRFSANSGNITGSGSTGTITMYRRRVFA